MLAYVLSMVWSFPDGCWKQGERVMEQDSLPRWLDALLAAWIVLVAVLYFAQFVPYLNMGLAVARRVLLFQ
ncbi:hypothetical protein MYX82_00080 [Acidobacteria bacterium AH-259-D05]|nr:hypothetical protein [Acidobacteria bacterium AH-259-D05]